MTISRYRRRKWPARTHHRENISITTININQSLESHTCTYVRSSLSSTVTEKKLCRITSHGNVSRLIPTCKLLFIWRFYSPLYFKVKSHLCMPCFYFLLFLVVANSVFLKSYFRIRIFDWKQNWQRTLDYNVKVASAKGSIGPKCRDFYKGLLSRNATKYTKNRSAQRTRVGFHLVLILVLSETFALVQHLGSIRPGFTYSV